MYLSPGINDDPLLVNYSPAAWEAVSRGWRSRHKQAMLSQKTTKAKRSGGKAQAIEPPLSKCKGLCSNPSTAPHPQSMNPRKCKFGKILKQTSSFYRWAKLMIRIVIHLP
jgi:hypothetical protein